MPNYTFELHDGGIGMADATGVSLPGRESAMAYAQDVVCELMRGREPQTRLWCLDVHEDDRKIFALHFAEFDHTLDHLRPQFRDTVGEMYEYRRSLAGAVRDVRQTVREARALVARSRGKLNVATEYGRPVIRDR